MSGYRIDVAFTPDRLVPADVAVVIDVLRATTTAAAALAAGYRRVHLVASLDAARARRAGGFVLAGEVRCKRPADFDLGNSPSEMSPPRGEDLLLATTNGAPAVVAVSAMAEVVLLGCLNNLDAVVARLGRLGVPSERGLLLVCSGTGGEVAVEDVYCAGRFVAALRARCDSVAVSDAALVAEAVAAASGPTEALAAGGNAVLMRAAGVEADIRDCARLSVLDVVPRVSTWRDGVATVVAER